MINIGIQKNPVTILNSLLSINLPSNPNKNRTRYSLYENIGYRSKQNEEMLPTPLTRCQKLLVMYISNESTLWFHTVFILIINFKYEIYMEKTSQLIELWNVIFWLFLQQVQSSAQFKISTPTQPAVYISSKWSTQLNEFLSQNVLQNCRIATLIKFS